LEYATESERDDAERLLQKCDDVKALQLLANDKRADPIDREKAQNLINKYGERIPRFASTDIMTRDEKRRGERRLGCRTRNTRKGRTSDGRAPDVAETLQDHRPALAVLVATWRGDQRKVGEAILKPDFNVRNVPGVDKSKVSRIYPLSSEPLKR